MALSNPWNLVTNSQTQPPSSITAYNYYESRETGKSSFATGNSQITRVFFCRFDQAYAFVDAVLGYSLLMSNAPNGYKIQRELPDQHPIVTTFYASEVASVEPLGTPSQDTSKGNLGTFPIAKVTAIYRPTDYAVLADDAIGTITVGDATIPNELERYVSVNRSYQQTEFLTVNGMLKFVESGRVINAPPGMVVGAYIETLKWVEVPAKTDDPFTPPNDTSLTACVGKVNTLEFNGHPAGTVLMLPPETKMVTPKLSASVLFTSSYIWEISMPFLIKDFGVNPNYEEEMGHFYLYDIVGPEPSKNPGWDLVTTDGTITGNRLYQAADLNKVWHIT